MKLSCTRENLFQGLAITSRISTKHVNLPILSNVLLRADGSGLKLISTNLEIAITCHIRGKVDQQGEYTVPSKLFFDFVNLLPNERVDIDLLDDTLLIACKNAQTKINGIAATEFPLVPPVNGSTIYSASVSELQQALSRVLFATASNESRPELSGVLMSFHHESTGEGSLTLAATDSYRLAETVLKLSGGSKEPKDVIVPQRTMSELARILGILKDEVDAPPAVEMAINENQIVFRFGSVELMSRTIEGKYPDYRQIIPTRSNTTLSIKRQDLIQGIKTASLFSALGLYDVKLGVHASRKQLELHATDAKRGENRVLLDTEVEGAENAITLNYRYLLDGLQAMEGETVALEVIDAGNPCVLRPKSMPDVKYTYIIMPIRQ